MSDSEIKKEKTPSKEDIETSAHKEQSKPRKASSQHEQASAAADEKSHSSSVMQPETKIGRKATDGSERKRNNAHKSVVHESRKSMGSEGPKSVISSNPEENLMVNKKTANILQNDKILLSNRIEMLKKEEERLMKKIKGTREKAEKIMEIKHRNEERFQQKLEMEELEKLRVEQERKKLAEERERRRKEFERQQMLILEDKKQVYHDYRQQKAFAVRHKAKVRLNVVKHNRMKRDLVKEEEQRIQERLRQREEEKRKRNQIHYSMRIDDQKKLIGRVDREIGAMEKEEKEILERLKNSQKLEQEAYRSLESAIKTSVEGTEWRKQVLNQRKVPIVKKIPKSTKSRSNNSSVYEQSIH